MKENAIEIINEILLAIKEEGAKQLKELALMAVELIATKITELLTTPKIQTT